jgi:predicted DNA-binding transcriptional regulator YafY
VAWEKDRPVPQNLPLDRILAFRETAERFVYPKQFDSRTYFQNLLGTTKTGAAPQPVMLHFRDERGKYVETKKMHSTQKAIWLPHGQLEVRLFLEMNRDLEARILEFGKDVEVMAPAEMRERIRENLQRALEKY